MKNLSSILGGDSFKERVKEKIDHSKFHQEIPESRELAPSVKKVIALVCDHFKVNKEKLVISKRGIENLPRDVAIYLIRCHSRVTLAHIGIHFEICSYSTVSSVVGRIKSRRNTDKNLQKHLKKIERKLVKGQR